MNTPVSSQPETKSSKRRDQRDRTPVQLGMPREIYRDIQERARIENISLAAWLRRLAIRELKRKPSL